MTDRFKDALDALDNMAGRTLSHLIQLGVDKNANVYKNIDNERSAILEIINLAIEAEQLRKERDELRDMVLTTHPYPDRR